MTAEVERPCPVRGCGFWMPSGTLRSHLARLHELSEAEVREIVQGEFVRRQYAKLNAGRDRMWRWTLDTFPAGDVAGRRALKQARHLLDNDAYALNIDGATVFIDGPPGSGKTGLAIGICREYVAIGERWGDAFAYGVEFENVRALLDAQRRRFARHESAALDHLLDAPRDTLIVLDDLGAERPTEYALDVLSLVIEQRHAIRAPLIVTTNYAPSPLAQRLGHEDLVIGQRIVSRLKDGMVRITIDRRDLRVTPREEDAER